MITNNHAIPNSIYPNSILNEENILVDYIKKFYYYVKYITLI